MSELTENSEEKIQEDDAPIVAQVISDIEEKHPDLFKNLENKEEIVSGVLKTIMSFEIEHHEEHHSGPLPSPQTLEGYNNVIPGGAERIFKTFENQVEHRLDLEKTALKSQTTQSKRGQVFGFVIAVVFLAAGMTLVMTGHEAAGITIFGLDIVGLVAVFVVGKHRVRKKLEDVE